jgi:diguanylate cyclase (GGDEF)-like protein
MKPKCRQLLARLSQADQDAIASGIEEREKLLGEVTPEQRADIARGVVADHLATLEAERADFIGQLKTPAVERRKDAGGRQRVAQMSAEDMRKALLTDDLTGLGNARALTEDLPEFSHVLAFDADSLKWVNDNLGHESGDELLKAWGRAIQEATDHGYRKSGDEFFALARSEDEAQTIARKVEDLLAQAVITAEAPDGERISINGIGASYGIGTDLKSSDTALSASKRERERAGKRAGRGEPPPGLARVAAQRVEDRVGEAADGQVNDGDRPVQHDQPGDLSAPGSAVEEPTLPRASEPDAAGNLERGQAGKLVKKADQANSLLPLLTSYAPALNKVRISRPRIRTWPSTKPSS